MKALAAWAKRLLPGGDGPARVVQSVLLGGGSRLLVVEFEGGRVLVGQGRGGLVRLASVSSPSGRRRLAPSGAAGEGVLPLPEEGTTTRAAARAASLASSLKGEERL